MMKNCTSSVAKIGSGPVWQRHRHSCLCAISDHSDRCTSPRRPNGAAEHIAKLARYLKIGFLLLIALPGLAQQPSRPLLIRGGTLIDGTGNPPEPGTSILIEGGAIRAVGKDVTAPGQADVVDASGKFIIPGLIDGRVKLGSSPANRTSRDEVDIEQQLQSLRALAEAGVTTVRLVQGGLDDQQFYQRAWEDDLLTGPRIVASGPTFTAPNGHPTEEYGFAALPVRDLQTREISSEDQARTQSREIARSGMQIFETVYDAGPTGHPYPLLSTYALGVIISTAHGYNRLAFCAVSRDKEAATALQWGADTIEGMWEEVLSKATLAEMAKKKAFFMPVLTDQGDLLNLIDPASLERDLHEPIVERTLSKKYRDSLAHPGGVLEFLRTQLSKYPEIRKQLEAQQRRAKENVRLALAAGVPLVVGTDTGNALIFPGAAVHRELQLLVGAGLSPMQAIVAATHNTAESLGVASQVGTIAPGKQAALVILSADPLKDIRNTEQIFSVIERGRVVAGAKPIQPAAEKAPKKAT